MIRVVLQKEFTEYRRDGRALGIASLIGLLVLGSLITGWSTHAAQQRQVRQAQQDDQAIFVRQGDKPSHSAAHFGRMAYKPLPALAVFDSGAAPYLGQVIWLEAHRQDPAMFRPAEDSPELRRLADLSVAGVLTVLLPLLSLLVGHGAFAAERERGTLRQIMSTGTGIDDLFAGKMTAVAAIGIVLSTVTVCVSVALALAAPGGVSVWDTLIRGAALVLGYGLYGLAFAAVALLVSARSDSATSALLTLLSVWTVSVVLLPRIAATVAEHVYPTPDSGIFWTETANAVRAARLDRDSPEFRATERLVLSRALGREVTAPEVASMDLNRRGLSFEVSEVLGARVYADAYHALYATYENQQRLRRVISVLSPAITLQHLSSALAGTDIAAHRHFALEAERQRHAVIRAMNEDLMLNGAQQGDRYLANADVWRSIPDFVYRPPPASLAFRSAAWDFLALVSWSAVALWLAWRNARRQSVV